MSGSKRKSPYRKSVISDYENTFPEPGEGEAVCRVAGNRGSNIFDVILPFGPEGSQDLATLPKKFVNLIFIKRNDFVIVENVHFAADRSLSDGADDLAVSTSDVSSTTDTDPSVPPVSSAGGRSLPASGDSLTAPVTLTSRLSIKHILRKDQINHLKKKGLWPERFEDVSGRASSRAAGYGGDLDDMPGLGSSGADDFGYEIEEDSGAGGDM